MRSVRRVSGGARRLALLTTLATTALLLVAGSASAAMPWWHLDTSVRPAVIPPGGEGALIARASNIGNSCTAEPDPEGDRCGEGAEAIASEVAVELPAGLELVEEGGVPRATFFALDDPSGQDHFAEYCSVSGRRITCGTEPTQAYIDSLFEPGGEFAFPPSDEPPLREIIEAAKRRQLTLPSLAPYEWIEIRARVKATSPEPGSAIATATGGGATALSRQVPVRIGGSPPTFGVEEYDLVPEEEGGSLDARAGSHPYQLTTTFALNQNAAEPVGNTPGHEDYGRPPALARNLHFRLPPGQIGNATVLPSCDALDFTNLVPGNANLCPPDTALGVASVTVDGPGTGLGAIGLHTIPVPLYNLQPAFGEPARFGFVVAGTPIILDTAVRSGRAGTPDGDYGVTVTTANTSQLVNFLAATVTFWGTPGDPSHDNARGWSCLHRGELGKVGGLGPCKPEEQKSPTAFLTLPTNCAAPFATTVEGDSWTSLSTPERKFLDPFTYSLEEAGTPRALIGCNQLAFDPRVHSEPTSNAATSPTGLAFDIDFEDQGLLNPAGRAQSQLKKALVTLPQGFTANPSVAEGLKACSEAEYEASTLEPNSGCTPESKIGDVEVTSPLVQPDQVLRGGLYVARQGENPSRDAQHPNGNLLTLYLVARNAEIGVVVKQALKVTPNPLTGQLTTEVDNVPELPFSHFHLSFRQGQRSPLITPPACGTYSVAADLSPWSNPDAPVHRESGFQITGGPEGLGCPSGGVPPFHPGLEAGTQNNAAGTYSPFYTHITRRDSEQEITHFSIKLPPGVLAKLAGVGECSDAAIAAAKALEIEGGGTTEEEHPSCPSSSEIGHSLVGSGVGNVLAYAPGKLYLAGPYHGSSISIVSITAAKVGPFDLGTVVVRFALRVNPETGEAFVDSTGSDPIPHIVDGIPVHLRDIRAYVDRPQFTLNPTSCEKLSTASTVLGSGLDFVSPLDDNPVVVSSPFQAADCASLPFKPKLSLTLKGSTKRGGNPALHAHLAMNGIGEAGLAYARTALPATEFLDNAHIGTVCTRVIFKEGAQEGEKCPAGSVIGHAKAVTPLLSEPLEGPIYLRSNPEQNLPDIAAALHGNEISVVAVGHTDSAKGGGVRNTFEVIPDAPVTSVDIDLFGGKKGLLENAPKGNANSICQTKMHATENFKGHNGKIKDFNVPIKATGCKKHKKHKRHHS